MHIDLDNPYLTQQAITYLGNKRKHLDKIDAAVTKIIANDEVLSRRLAGGLATAADPFSGSGIVGRLLRARKFVLYANDVELYTHPINTAWLTTDPNLLDKYFEAPARWLAKRLGIKVARPYYNWVVSELNKMTTPKRAYFSKHYSPAQTASPCFETERIFYTQENAKRLDCWMEVLHETYWKKHPEARSLLMASVLYQMSTKINTSGTMKAFHKGWGGPNGDALGRIMSPMKIQPLPVVSGPPAFVSCGDAREMALPLGSIIDIAYLDPPGHQQQYSSNYHLLTSFCTNGKYNPGPVEHGSRAGIPPDHFRSQYCKSRAASYEMTELVEYWSERSRYIVCTYDSNGLLSYTELFKILQNDNANKVDFIRYGEAGSELLFIVKTNTRVSTHFHEMRMAQLNNKVEVLPLRDKHACPTRLSSYFKVTPTKQGWAVYEGTIKIFSLNYDYKVIDIHIQAYAQQAAEAIKAALLDKEDLAKKYIAERRSNSALKVLLSMRKPTEKNQVSNYLKSIYELALESGETKLLKKLDAACGKLLRITVANLVDLTKHE